MRKGRFLREPALVLERTPSFNGKHCVNQGEGKKFGTKKKRSLVQFGLKKGKRNDPKTLFQKKRITPRSHHPEKSRPNKKKKKKKKTLAQKKICPGERVSHGNAMEKGSFCRPKQLKKGEKAQKNSKESPPETTEEPGRSPAGGGGEKDGALSKEDAPAFSKGEKPLPP